MVEPRNDSSHDGTTMELVSDCEIVISRSFAAPARLVFEAVTRPEHIRRWWAPSSRGVMTVCEVDFRIGGRYRYVMRTNDGTEVGFSGTYHEIEAPHRVVQTEVFDPFPESGSTVTMTLVEVDGRTTMTNRCVYPSRMVRDMVVASGMEGGMRESLRQLTDVVRSLG